MYWEPNLDLCYNLPGFSALTGFKAPFHGNGQSALNPGTTVFEPSLVVECIHPSNQSELRPKSVLFPAELKPWVE